MDKVWVISDCEETGCSARDILSRAGIAASLITKRSPPELSVSGIQSLPFPDTINSQVLSTLTHDLRHPASMTIQCAGLLQNQCYGQLSDKQTVVVGHILSNSQQLLEQIDALLEWLRAEADCLHLEPTRLNLRHFLPEAVNALQQDYPAAEIILDMNLNEGFITCDRNRLRYILNTMVEYVLSRTRTGQIHILARESYDSWSIDMELSPLETGMLMFNGISLLLTNALVQKFHGQISVEQQRNHNACLRVTLPRDYRMT
ncbi:MAG: hypothetical protein QNJ46_22635 [Leptolyngbyaceae cyanobacterium MO_188.B28]|nr:hypothetical protein [Leptolyngbyaceae cyanobacterium MO_188.B28]